MPPVSRVPRQPIARPKPLERGEDFGLQAFATLVLRFLLPEPDQEITNERAHRGLALGRLAARLPVDVIRK